MTHRFPLLDRKFRELELQFDGLRESLPKLIEHIGFPRHPGGQEPAENVFAEIEEFLEAKERREERETGVQ